MPVRGEQWRESNMQSFQFLITLLFMSLYLGSLLNDHDSKYSSKYSYYDSI